MATLTDVLRRLHRGYQDQEGTGPPDADLLKRYSTQGDESAFEALVRRHGPMVLGVCRRVLGNEADAEDAFQAAFLVLVRKSAAIRSSVPLGNWLYGVAYRTALHARHAAVKRRAREAAMPTRTETPEGAWVELLPVLDQELERLPEKYRAVIVLCELQGKTRKEAARELRCAEGTVASRLARGLALLAKRLARYGRSFTAGALAAVLSQKAASASVPPSVVSATVQAAALVAAGQATAGVVSGTVAALAEGMVKTMLLSQLKAAVMGLLLAAALAGAAGLLYQTQAAGEPPTTRGKEPVSPAGASQAPAEPARAKPGDQPLPARGQEPVPAADQYRALIDEHRQALKEADAVFFKAQTAEERQKIRTDFKQVRDKLIGRFLALAEKHPRDKEAIAAVFFVLHPDSQAERRDADRAVELILKDHVASNHTYWLGSLLRMFAELDFAIAEKPLRTVLAKNPHPSMQAQACLSLGQLLADRAEASTPEQAARLFGEAEELLERVVTRYAAVKEVAEKAKSELYVVRHLTVGKVMPDIKGKDSADKDLKLSDYRGKVVVLTFWAGWCPPCLKLVEHERALGKRLEGKPFALVGVNRDLSRDNQKQCEEKHQITWRSFRDGRDGPISKEHRIKFMPAVYVLDAKGVIRFKGVRGEAMDRAVDQLLAELAKEEGPGQAEREIPTPPQQVPPVKPLTPSDSVS